MAIAIHGRRATEARAAGTVLQPRSAPIAAVECYPWVAYKASKMGMVAFTRQIDPG